MGLDRTPLMSLTFPSMVISMRYYGLVLFHLIIFSSWNINRTLLMVGHLRVSCQGRRRSRRYSHSSSFMIVDCFLSHQCFSLNHHVLALQSTQTSTIVRCIMALTSRSRRFLPVNVATLSLPSTLFRCYLFSLPNM
jgi:hypothetical protein